MDFYKQCTLQKDNTTTVSWIPEQFAKINAILKLKNDKKEWDDGWRVIVIGNVRLSGDVVAKQERAHKDFSYD